MTALWIKLDVLSSKWDLQSENSIQGELGMSRRAGYTIRVRQLFLGLEWQCGTEEQVLCCHQSALYKEMLSNAEAIFSCVYKGYCHLVQSKKQNGLG